ncbi:hypothetical protein QR680_003980 [Steinernema hermaphroditum]|uniref:Uncharacterized protein n=1 Tax=Steinernema hermaphroditum TaxID=289476 RepID=A0AA39HM99_9BILA|nr:hypothetical protein QR680_003980 [Steinernema hermaphroditum]
MDFYNKKFGAAYDSLLDHRLYGIDNAEDLSMDPNAKKEAELPSERITKMRAELEPMMVRLRDQQRTFKGILNKMREERKAKPCGGKKPFPEYAVLHYEETDGTEEVIEVPVCQETGCIEKRVVLTTDSKATGLSYYDDNGDLHLLTADDHGYYAPPPQGWDSTKVMCYRGEKCDDDEEEEPMFFC